MRYVEIGCRGLLLAVFAWSAAGKLRSRESVTRLARSLAPVTGLLPVRVPDLAVAAALLVSEVATVALLVVAPLAGLAAAGALSGALTAGAVVVVRRGLAVTCRCFGGDGGRIDTRHVLRNATLVLVCAAGLGSGLLARGDHGTAGGAVVAVAAGVIAGIVVARLDDLVELFAAPPRPGR